jgi:hypothetical protein
MPSSAPASTGQTESPPGVVSAVAAYALFASLWIALSDAAFAWLVVLRRSTAVLASAL